MKHAYPKTKMIRMLSLLSKFPAANYDCKASTEKAGGWRWKLSSGGVVVAVDSTTTYNEKKAVYITELGVYNLIFRSSIVAAKQFKKWVTSRGITAKCLEYERHFEKIRKLYRETLEIHGRKVGAVEKFYIESMSDAAMKAIEDELLWVFLDLQNYNHKLLLPFK